MSGKNFWSVIEKGNNFPDLIFWSAF